jgi:hypothetical protein
MSKYMLIMRPTDESLAENFSGDFDDILTQVGTFNNELMAAGVLLAMDGFDPSDSIVVDFTAEKPVVTDGPYGETKELFSGFYVLDVASREEAVEWAKRMPLTKGGKVEIRRIPTVDEFPQDNEFVIKETEWRKATGQL